MKTFEEKFAENLKAARKRRGLTQEDLAQKIGITNNGLSQYENAKRLPNIKRAARMSMALGMSLDDLVPLAVCEMPVDDSQTNIYDLIGESNEDIS
jgi:transcriptional regulator with XRE-family HTH domain